MPYLFVNKSFFVRVVLSFLILVQNLIPLLYIDKAYADAEEYDLRVSKTSSSTWSLVSGQVVVYTIAYGNSGSNTVTWATLWDSFWTGLIYSGILSSTPSLGSPMLNTWVSPHTLTWSNITMWPNMSWNIQLQFVVNGTQLSSGSFIQNQAQLSGCSQSCTQEAKETSQSASFIVQWIPYAPSTSDLYVKKYVWQCNIWWWWSISCSNTSTTGYKVWDTVYFSYHYKNTGTNLRDNVVLVDQYDGNLSFSHIVSTSGPLWSYQLAQWGTMFNSDMRYGIVSWSDGMTLNPGQSGMVVMAFKITTDKIGTILNNVKIWTLTDPGELWKILYLTGSPSPLIVGETNSINNLSNTGIVTRPFDHRITKQLISGTPGPNAVVTYRLSICCARYYYCGCSYICWYTCGSVFFQYYRLIMMICLCMRRHISFFCFFYTSSYMR